MNTRISLIGVVLLALICWSGPAQASILLSEDFESYSGATTSWYSTSDNDPGSPWTILESQQEKVQVMRSPVAPNGGAYVFDTPYGSQFLQTWRDGASPCEAWVALDSAAQATIATNGNMHVEIDAHNVSGHDNYAGAIAIHGWDSAPGGGYTGRAFSVSLRPEGLVWPYTGTTVKNTALDAVFDCNTWEKLIIDVDFVTDRWSLTIDNVTVADLAFAGGDLSKIQYISMGATDVAGLRGRGGWDNLIVSSVPEPSVLTLVFPGLAGLLAYAWRKRR